MKTKLKDLEGVYAFDFEVPSIAPKGEYADEDSDHLRTKRLDVL